ncbi:MAG: cyclase family protein [Planctomycetota bacterium]
MDEMPLDRFYGPGVVLDVRHLEPDAVATIADLREGLTRIKHTLRPRDVVLVQTGNDRFLGSRDYLSPQRCRVVFPYITMMTASTTVFWHLRLSPRPLKSLLISNRLACLSASMPLSNVVVYRV